MSKQKLHVYVVLHFEYEGDTKIIGVYSSREIANNVANSRRSKRRWNQVSNYAVLDFPVTGVKQLLKLRSGAMLLSLA